MKKLQVKGLFNVPPPSIEAPSIEAVARPLPAETVPSMTVQAAPSPPAADVSRHPGQRTPFLIPAGATPEQVTLWTDLKIVVSPDPYGPETPEERESTVWVIAVGLARDRDRNLFDTLRQLRAWGARLAWTDRGGLRLVWRHILPRVPAGEWTMSHKMEVLARNQAAIIGVPEEYHDRLVTLLERYLEPCRESIAKLFKEIAAGWPEDARW